MSGLRDLLILRSRGGCEIPHCLASGSQPFCLAEAQSDDPALSVFVCAWHHDVLGGTVPESELRLLRGMLVEVVRLRGLVK